MNLEWIDIQPVKRPVTGSIRPPGSKSLSNRALLLAALADGPSRLTGLADGDDTRIMATALQRLGCDVTVDWASGVAEVAGGLARRAASRSRERVELFVGNSGTTARFLTAALAVLGGRYRLHGEPRMHQRPIEDLVRALQSLGCQVQALSPGGCPPVEIDSPRSPGGRAEVASSISSQYLSGLLMAAPLANGAVILEASGAPVSAPFLAMTLAVMERFGIQPAVREANRWEFQPARYRPCDFEIEPDATAASYFFAAAAITGGQVTVTHVATKLPLCRSAHSSDVAHSSALRSAQPSASSISYSTQGDFRFVSLLEQMGCRIEHGPDSITVHGQSLHGIDCDMADCSDTAQTLAVVALFCEGPTTIRGIAHNRSKETDRIGHLAAELRKTGVRIDEHADGLTIHPGPLHAATFSTWNDHRMAMSLALVGLRQPGIRILDPGCVSKTYPHFFTDLLRLAPPT